MHSQVEPDDTTGFVRDESFRGWGGREAVSEGRERGWGGFLHILLVEGLAVKVLGKIHQWVRWVQEIISMSCTSLRILLLGHVEVVICVVHGVLGDR